MPEIVRIKRLVKHWQKEAAGYDISQDYWDALDGTMGKQGPISLTRHILERYAIGCTTANEWIVKGRPCTVTDTMVLAQKVAEQVQDILLRGQAKSRTHVRGLEHGRDEDAMETLMSEVRSPKMQPS